jgi:phage anti-repressor protein
MDLITFLKTHSKINNDFIEDFFSFYSNDNKYNFSVDLDKIAKWMNTRKSDLKETLVNSYRQNIDYIIIKNKLGKSGVQPETILLTPKCFKLMSMQSKTKKAIQVREYYYELEEIVDKYKEYIIQGLVEKIKKLENNQKPKINPTRGIIYN